jgi:hypothetical protein
MQNLVIDMLDVECTHGSIPLSELKQGVDQQDSIFDSGYFSDNDSDTDSNVDTSSEPFSVFHLRRKPLGGPYERHNIIVLTPDSSPLLSPVSECSDANPFFVLRHSAGTI